MSLARWFRDRNLSVGGRPRPAEAWCARVVPLDTELPESQPDEIEHLVHQLCMQRRPRTIRMAEWAKRQTCFSLQASFGNTNHIQWLVLRPRSSSSRARRYVPLASWALTNRSSSKGSSTAAHVVTASAPPAVPLHIDGEAFCWRAHGSGAWAGVSRG